MAITLKYEDIARILTDIKQHPTDENKKLEFINLISPIIKVTTDQYPKDMADDMTQEMTIFIMKRSDYIAEAFANDKIKNPTNYLFTVCRNTALNFYKKEAKAKTNLVPLDDIKIEPVFTPKTHEKSKVLEEVRVLMMAFIKVRYQKAADQKIAERFLTALLQGKRPSFMSKPLHKFTKHKKQENSKEIYSVVLLKMRELIEPRIEELTE